MTSSDTFPVSEVNEERNSNTGNIANFETTILSLADFSKRVLVVGDIIIDKYIYGTCSRIAPECPIPVFDEDNEEYRLGGTGNVVNNLIALGLAVDIVSMVGHDDKRIIRMLNQENVDISGLVMSENHSLKTITRYISNQHQCLRADKAGICKCPDETQKMLLDKLKNLIGTREYHVIVMSDYGQGVFSETTAQFIISNSRRHGIPTIVDPGKRGRYDRFYGATYIKLNHKEICNYSGHKGDIVDGCRDVCEKLKSQVSIATLSEKGIAFYHKELSPQFQILPIPRKSKVVDVCGAGDTVLAALTFGIAHKIPLVESCQFSILCSQNVIQNFGTSPVSLINVLTQKIITTKQELENFKHFIPRSFKVVLTVGCFDTLDMEHLEYLQQAKEQGDLLLVALNSDVSLSKCGHRPNIPLEQRCGMLLATKYVDFIVTFDDAPKWIIDIVEPGIFMTGFGDSDGHTNPTTTSKHHEAGLVL